MHTTAPSKPADRRRQAGFSLPEVAMAIGIIAIAFVALIALLPTGMTQMRLAMDSNNGTRIVQSFVSRALATDYQKLNQLENVVHYFDDEGSPLDNSVDENNDLVPARIYAARVYIQPGQVEQDTKLAMTYSSRLVIAYGNIFESRASELINVNNWNELQQMLLEKKPKPNVTVRPVTITKTDGR